MAYTIKIKSGGPHGAVKGTKGPYSTRSGAVRAAQPIANQNPRHTITIEKNPKRKKCRTNTNAAAKTGTAATRLLAQSQRAMDYYAPARGKSPIV